MKVQDVMTRNVATCGTSDNLATAAGLMWEYDCGVVPIVDDERKVVGVITDRDICMALALNNRLASEVSVREVASGRVFTGSPQADVRELLSTMKSQQILRVPIVESDGTLIGIVSLSDLVQRADEIQGQKKPEISYEQVVDTRKAITEPTGAATSTSGKA
jgi:CBS domain-containing protein